MKGLAEWGGHFAETLMFDALSTAKAWEMLHDPTITQNLNAEGYLGLCKAAGYGEDASQRAASEWANRRLDKGLTA